MTPEDLIRLQHMLDAVKEALAFSRDKSREDLDNNRMLTLAIVKELEIIGEAASKITPEFKKGGRDVVYLFTNTHSDGIFPACQEPPA